MNKKSYTFELTIEYSHWQLDYNLRTSSIFFFIFQGKFIKTLPNNTCQLLRCLLRHGFDFSAVFASHNFFHNACITMPDKHFDRNLSSIFAESVDLYFFISSIEFFGGT